MSADGVGDQLGLGQRLIIGEPQYGPAERFERLLSFNITQGDVFACVNSAVDLDDELQVVAGEVDAVRTDGMLAAEFAAVDPARTEKGPDPVLGET